jgi:hypothetical protein
MRAKEFIVEGMTFSPAIEQEYIDDSGERRKLMTGEPWWAKSDEQCWVCNGTGKDPYTDGDIDCGYCHGKKTYTKHGSTAPELNVSNVNGWEIQKMLGLDPDYAGTIYNKDLPNVMRKLIRLKNQGVEQHTQAPSVEQGKATHWKDDRGISHIIAGPKMHDAGRSNEQVMRYVDKLIELVQFAQKNNAHISWG